MDLKMKDEAGNWNSLKRMMLDSLHPVGSIYIDMGADLTTCPIQRTLGGTWAREAGGRVLVGYAGDQAEFNAIRKTGGAKTHALTVSEMPAHSHTLNTRFNATGFGAAIRVARPTDSGSDSTAGDYVNSTGGGAAHNNLQPYITVNIWRRTA